MEDIHMHFLFLQTERMALFSEGQTGSGWLTTLLLLILLLPVQARAAESGRCAMCGMDLTKYAHTRYEVTTKAGTHYRTCGVQCGLMLQLNLGDRFDHATATDLLTHKKLASDKAWYVFHSSVITDMAPGFIAFASKDNAQKFIKAFGGQLMNYKDALAQASKIRHCRSRPKKHKPQPGKKTP